MGSDLLSLAAHSENIKRIPLETTLLVKPQSEGRIFGLQLKPSVTSLLSALHLHMLIEKQSVYDHLF